MEFIDLLMLGFSHSLTPTNLFYCLVGALLGTLIGVLPGVGPTATIAMLLPITFSLPPLAALVMLAGIYYGAQYGGSTTAILLNVPGEATAAVTAIDGHQMAKNGRPGPALAIAALGSFFAGTIGTLLIAILALPLAALALKFGAPEYFSLMVLALVTSVALAHGSLLKAFAMIFLGLAFGMIGTDVYTGAQRFTFGNLQLADGVSIVALAVGTFGVSEILRNMESRQAERRLTAKVQGLLPSRDELRRSIGPVLRGTFLGSLLGVLPGGGPLLASFGSYSMEKNISRHPETFGKGAVEGIAGPESANNAGAQTSFIPMLTLGIPANPVLALLLGAMILQGIQPGPNVAVRNPDIFWGLITSMWIGNVMLVVLNLPLIGIWVRLLSIPYKALFPTILVFSSIGTFSVTGNVFDLYSIVFFGLLAYLLIKLGCEPAPFILGFILGPIMEETLRRAMILSNGDPLIFVQRPISATLLAFSAIAVLFVVLPMISNRRADIFVED
ncbi:tripartite tricarboxylate transporter permease [Pelagibacterium lacus]|uniref:Tripartite tricarboxylate transporter permease n=1 Tax=Pelagibacterium lacus TaxID=2282655 RepID=A0A369W972_9HYPH|nr:tripartite tricarboxylate transporter permease [Pelagibacterium lacus]RDE10519.1 tripartite tricarboxylate transporter permease [Pelagibacterium lacus]